MLSAGYGILRTLSSKVAADNSLNYFDAITIIKAAFKLPSLKHVDIILLRFLRFELETVLIFYTERKEATAGAAATNPCYSRLSYIARQRLLEYRYSESAKM